MSSAENLSVVIPSYNEVSLIPVLMSLNESSLSSNITVHIFLVINAAENADDEIKNRNRKCYEEALNWSSEVGNSLLTYTIDLHNDLDPKKAGVGLARKLGMDKAAEFHAKTEKDGIIVALDADCLVEENYLEEISKYYGTNKEVQAANIYFEHRFESEDHELNEAAIQYELHLRYYKHCLAFIGFPYDYHTVGSSMSVRSATYLKSGGMNTRQAGEDFYFLQKLFSQYAFGEINSTTVYPDGRFSNRVPFGTGAALLKWEESGRNDIPTYPFESFLEIGSLLKIVPDIFRDNVTEIEKWSKSIGKDLIDFLIKENFEDSLNNFMNNSRNMDQFKSHFFRWFNNFKILKCLNYLRDKKRPMQSVIGETAKLLIAKGIEAPSSSLDMLLIIRNLDKTKPLTKPSDLA